MVSQEILRALLLSLGPGEGVDLGMWRAEKVLEVARRHRLSALIGAHRNPALPRDLWEATRRDHIQCLGRNTALKAILGECVTAMREKDIASIALKGLVYDETLYARPGSRATSDVDLMVRAGNQRRAMEVLSDLGFEPLATSPGFDEADYHEVEFRRGWEYVDLHAAFVPLPRCAVDYGAVWSQARDMKPDGVKALMLAPVHAAVYHTLHMAVHHFDLPAIYLVDLSRMLECREDFDQAEALARAWRCHRPWRTVLALAATFLPWWRPGQETTARSRNRIATRVVESFGQAGIVGRSEQLRRKLQHFDLARDAMRYAIVQGRRATRELIERKVRKRSARLRLGLCEADGKSRQ